MRTVTVGNLKTRTRERADAVGDTSWVSDAELGRLLDAAYTELVDMLVTADIHLFETSSNVTTDGTNDTYTLPTDFYKLLGVDYRWSASPARYVGVDVVTFGERNRYDSPFVSTLYGAYAAGYRLVGNGIKFSPLPPTGQVYRLTYVPAPAAFATLPDNTNVDGIAGWDELLVVLAAIRMANKEGASIGELVADRDRLAARIAQMAVDRQPVQSIAPDPDDSPWRDARYPYGRSRWRD